LSGFAQRAELGLQRVSPVGGDLTLSAQTEQL